VGLMHRGRLVRCDTPARLKQSVEEACYKITGADSLTARVALEKMPGVLSVEPSGAAVHVFAARSVSRVELERAAGGKIEEITPSLEDVFIAVIRKEELAHAVA
jgi:ABC-2 type transport system ATP-binding protein